MDELAVLFVHFITIIVPTDDPFEKGQRIRIGPVENQDFYFWIEIPMILRANKAHIKAQTRWN